MKISNTINPIILLFALSGIFAKCEQSANDLNLDSLYPKQSAVSFSQDFLLSIKSDEPFQNYLDTLKVIDLDKLESELNTQDKQLCFWINTYNSLVQAKVKLDTSSYQNRDHFFKNQDLTFGGVQLSLDDIEQGILRKQKSYNSNKIVGRFKLEKLDNRIHFALNCGAAACPPIAFYSVEKLNDQLDLAEEVFIENSSSFDNETGVLNTSKILDWYKDDFNGEKGIVELMRKHNILQDQEVKELTFTPYDWTLDLNNY